MADAAPQEKQATKMRNVLVLVPSMFRDVDQQIGWFQSKGFLARARLVLHAVNEWTHMIQTHSDVTDKYRYVCKNSVKHNVPRA